MSFSPDATNCAGWTSVFFQLISVYFSSLLSYNLYQSMCHNHRLTRNIFVQSCVVAIICGFVCATIPLLSDQYGNTGLGCWITITRHESIGNIERLLTNLQIYFSVFIAFYFFRKVLNKLDIIAEDSSSLVFLDTLNRAEIFVRKLMYYPMISSVCWLPLLLLRVFDGCGISFIPSIVYSIAGAIGMSQGVWNAVIFLSESRMKNHWLGLLQRLFAFGRIEHRPTESETPSK